MHSNRRRANMARDARNNAAADGNNGGDTMSAGLNYYIPPPSLYTLSLRALATNFAEAPLHLDRLDLKAIITDDMRLDLYVELFLHARFDILIRELSNIDNFVPLLNLGEKRTRLHAMMQSVIDRGFDLHYRLAEQLTDTLDNTSTANNNSNVLGKQFGVCVNFASFLVDAGWYETSETLLRHLKERLQKHPTQFLAVEHECAVKLLHSLSSFSKFPEAEIVYREMVKHVQQQSVCHGHLPSYYAEFSYYCFLRSQYSVAFRWALESVRLLDCKQQPPRVLVDVLRQASKACVVRRQFPKAEILIQEAVLLAKEVYGEKHPKYADCLTDYGFYLLNVDSIAKSLQAYKTALEVRIACFGGHNLRVAFSHEDLAYATYVKEYNTGRFKCARHHAERALEIMSRLLPTQHLLLASSQRVLALILEEIAIDESNKVMSKKMLTRAEELHLCALDLSVKAFGQMNVQTSKHYGNLGRLYQSMELFGKAEEMHLRAIDIKERLLGRDDYEVALSIGHLASLYNYDLKEFGKAETLYLRSITIGVKLFGPSYSGLEYDYRGLIRVYQETQEWDKCYEFTTRLRDWKELRDRRDNQSLREDVLAGGNPKPISKVIATVMLNVDSDPFTDIASLSSSPTSVSV